MTMRVISGTYRGLKLESPLDDNVRPTIDRVKEAIFNIIQFKVRDSFFLDLFSGSGAIGIEAISRGANKVVFCDEKTTLLKKNLAKLKNHDYEIFQSDYKNILTNLSSRGIKFDIVYLDPPFNSCFGEEAVELIIKKQLLTSDGIICFEHETTKKLDFNFDVDIVDTRKYGYTTITMLKQKKAVFE